MLNLSGAVKILHLLKGSMSLVEVGWHHGKKMNQASTDSTDIYTF
jgi:hypothetical protein